MPTNHRVPQAKESTVSIPRIAGDYITYTNPRATFSRPRCSESDRRTILRRLGTERSLFRQRRIRTLARLGITHPFNDISNLYWSAPDSYVLLFDRTMVETDQVNNAPFDKALADRLLMSMVQSAVFEGFCAQPRLSMFMERFLGALSRLHKRKNMRYTLCLGLSWPPRHTMIWSNCVAAPKTW